MVNNPFDHTILDQLVNNDIQLKSITTMKLQGKTALITGGNSGIGYATAEAFINEGARVIIVGRRAEAVAEAAERLGDQAIGLTADVAKVADLDALFTRVSEEVGTIDTLVVNAGVAPANSIETIDEAFFDHVFGVNVKGAYFTVQKALPHLNDGGSIVLVTSAGNVKGMPPLDLYVATKAAVRSLTRSLAAALVPRGIRVNAISPGPIQTPIFGKMGLPQQAVEEFGAQVTQMVPLGRAGEGHEIAQPIVFLASDDASYIVGAELVADGGMTQL